MTYLCRQKNKALFMHLLYHLMVKQSILFVYGLFNSNVDINVNVTPIKSILWPRFSCEEYALKKHIRHQCFGDIFPGILSRNWQCLLRVRTKLRLAMTNFHFRAEEATNRRPCHFFSGHGHCYVLHY